MARETMYNALSYFSIQEGHMTAYKGHLFVELYTFCINHDSIGRVDFGTQRILNIQFFSIEQFVSIYCDRKFEKYIR